MKRYIFVFCIAIGLTSCYRSDIGMSFFYIDNQTDINMQTHVGIKEDSTHRTEDGQYETICITNDTIIHIPAHQKIKLTGKGAVAICLRPNEVFNYLCLINEQGDTIYRQNPIDNNLWLSSSHKRFYTRYYTLVYTGQETSNN